MKKATTTMKKRNPESLRGKEGKGGKSPCQPRKHSGPSAGRLIDARIKELSDWRGETLARVRILIKQADPEVIEEWKWRGVPVWSHAGMICTGETYKNVVKMTFAKGASLEDPSGLFNSSLEGNTRRAIDFHEGDKIDEKALQALIRAAVALNTSSASQGQRASVEQFNAGGVGAIGAVGAAPHRDRRHAGVGSQWQRLFGGGALAHDRPRGRDSG